MNEVESVVSAPTYTIKTEQFEGPLDVLLNLIEKRKLLINQISLAEVTEEFIHFAERITDTSLLRQKSSFVAIASILLLIKAKSLLPVLEVTEEEQVDIADLEKRLKMLELMRGVGKVLGAEYGVRRIFSQGNFRNDIRVFAPSKDISVSTLSLGIQQALASVPKKEIELPKVKVRQVKSLEEMMHDLESRIQSAFKMTFTSFAKIEAMDTANLPPEEVIEIKRVAKQHVVVSFLALLELVKQNTLIAEQSENFAEIDITNSKM